MRIVLPLIALVFTAAAAPAAEQVPALDRAPVLAVQDAPRTVPMFDGRPAVQDGQSVCRDRIQQVRDERGLPKLDYDNAKPDEGLLIAAVDQRIDGCSVMVMRNDTSDIRPLPAAPEGPARMQRIPGQ
jgi:hypothetical protein